MASAPKPETAPEGPAPLDPRELLGSANAASGPARNAWLAFLGLLAYLLVTLAGVSHVDLLLNSPVTLPIVNVKIPLFSFFLAAPFMFLLVHLGLLVQHAMLAHKYQHFSEAIAGGETGYRRDHPDRRLVHSYVFSQMLAGPTPPPLLQMLMRLMVFVTLSLLPILVLLYFQIKFLPSHEVAITHAHRLAILLDIVLLFIVRPFIAMPYLRPQGKKLRLGNENWRWEISYTSLGLAGSLSLGVVLFSLLVATVPQACVWPFGEQTDDCASLDRTMARLWPVEVESGTLTRVVFAPTKWLFEGKPDKTTGTPESLFSRNLVVIDKDLVAKKEFDTGETSLPLRGRNLRFAVLDRSDLQRADLYGADLRGLSGIDTRLDYAELEQARMQGADLSRAQIQGANLSWAQVTGADFGWAQMQGVALIGARMQGADLSRAKMQGADLSQTKMQGADLSGALMQGADFSFAQMQGADLSYTQIQAANLSRAWMQGADLRGARIDGADLSGARMQGAHLNGAQMRGANLSGARIWQTKSPRVIMLKLAMPMERELIAPLDPDEKSGLEKLVTDAKDETLLIRLQERLGPLLDSGAAEGWESSKDHKVWSDFSSLSRPDPAELSTNLAKLACSDASGGYITEGIALRISRYREAYAKLTAAKLVNQDSCPAAKHLSKEARAHLKKFAATMNTEAESTPAE